MLLSSFLPFILRLRVALDLLREDGCLLSATVAVRFVLKTSCPQKAALAWKQLFLERADVCVQLPVCIFTSLFMGFTKRWRANSGRTPLKSHQFDLFTYFSSDWLMERFTLHRKFQSVSSCLFWLKCSLGAFLFCLGFLNQSWSLLQYSTGVYWEFGI